MNTSISIKSIASDFLLPSIQFKPYALLKDKKISDNEYITKQTSNNEGLIFKTELQGVFRDTLYFSRDENAVICRRVFDNISSEAINLCELGVKISDIDFGFEKRDNYFYHNENPRIYGVLTFPVDYKRTADDAVNSEFDFKAGNRWADPGVISERIGASPYQPFPAILLSNYNTDIGLVHGTLSQRVFFHNYLVRNENDGICIDVLSSFKCVDALCVEAGHSLVDEWYIGTTEKARNIEMIFEDYTRVLRKKLPVSYGRSDANRNSLVWGSWNDGVFRNISEEKLLTEAKFLKENFPTVKWLQVDDGYSSSCTDIAHGLGVPYEGKTGIDYTKFPNGLRHFTDEVRNIGLRPAVWVGGACPKKSKLYMEHPEWFIDYSYRVNAFAPLDVSQMSVREYMEEAIEALVNEYGFDAVKHDFWSYAFEDSHDLYAVKNKSGYEHRRWWLQKVRDALPNDGYLQTGCDIVMGNPFLGEFFTNYRYGVDIAEGDWENVKTNFLWGAACFATHTGDLFVPNSDSIELFPGLSDKEAMFYINYCMITHSMVEIAGLLSRSGNKKRINILRKAACNPNNGQDVYFADFDYRSHTDTVPEIMYCTTPHFSAVTEDMLPLCTAAIFNIGEESKVKVLNAEKLNLTQKDYILTDVWSGEQFLMKAGAEFVLEPHESRLFAINNACGVQIFDANFKINKVSMNENIILIETDYKMSNAEIMINTDVKKVCFNDASIAFEVTDGILRFDIPDAGIISVVY